MKSISIIVPFYNAEKTLSKCIKSILFQTFTNFELLLIDDGSTDTSYKICKEFQKKDNRIRVIKLKNRKGVSNARNHGIETAKSKYITFCDADDYLLKNYLNDLMLNMIENDVQLVSSGYEIENNKVINKHRRTEHDEIIDLTIKRFSYLENISDWEVWSKIFDLGIIRINKIKFCTSCNDFAEDLCFYLEYLLYCNKIMIISNCNYRYVQNTNSMMYSSKKLIMINELNEVSYQFGNRFLLCFPKEELVFSRIFYVLIHNQSVKIFYDDFGLKEIMKKKYKIDKVEWYERWLKKISMSINKDKNVINNLKKYIKQYIEISYLKGKNTPLLLYRFSKRIFNTFL